MSYSFSNSSWTGKSKKWKTENEIENEIGIGIGIGIGKATLNTFCENPALPPEIAKIFFHNPFTAKARYSRAFLSCRAFCSFFRFENKSICRPSACKKTGLSKCRSPECVMRLPATRTTFHGFCTRLSDGRKAPESILFSKTKAPPTAVRLRVGGLGGMFVICKNT